MELNLSITIADEATPHEITIAFRNAAREVERLAYGKGIPATDGEQHQIYEMAHRFGAPRAFTGVFYRSA